MKFLSFYYLWKGINLAGEEASGMLLASNKKQATLLLKHQKIIIKKISKKYHLVKNLFSAKDFHPLCYQLGSLLKSGIPLLQSTKILHDSCKNEKIQFFLSSIHKEISSGNSLSQTLLNKEYQIDCFSHQLIILGEATGLLAEMLIRIYEHEEKRLTLIKKVKEASFYPLLIMLTTLVITFSMLIFIIPSFEQVFLSSLEKLPLYTRNIMAVSHLVSTHYFLIFGVIIVLIALLIYLFKNKKLWNAFLLQCIRFPIFKEFYISFFLIYFSSSLATTSAAGIPLLEGIKLIKHASFALNIEKIIEKIEYDLMRGKTLASSLLSHSLFPQDFVQIIQIGEETGTLENMLKKLEQTYLEKLNVTILYLKKLIEPLLMIIVGVLIGGLMIAMYLPIFKLGSAF